MSPDRIKQVLGRRPFQPFAIYTGDGSTVNVLSQEFAFLKPGGRTLEVSVPKVRNAREESDFEEHTIDVFLIAKVVSPIVANKRRAG
ncbi:MAG: hypothetical protein H7144_17570 [Burkholderiales bacterium]|nr:hypothetical protein [Phycisphaerae bacterium]